MQKRILIDWLRFTLDRPSETAELIDEFGLMVSEASPQGFYNTACEFHGARGVMGRADWHTEHPEQKVCYTFSGNDLDVWREQDKIERLLAFAVAHKGKFTRIDVAIDVLDDSRVDWYTLAHMADYGQMDTRAKTHSVIRSVRDGKTGITIYVGGRQSDKFMRIYDKAAEQGIGADWARIELECKGDYAKAMGVRLLADGMDFARGEIERFCTFDLQWWRDAVAGHVWDKVDVDRTPGNRRRWQDEVLFGMVADALVENDSFRLRLIALLQWGGFDETGEVE